MRIIPGGYDYPDVLRRLVELSQDRDRLRVHEGGIEYTSLMMCFLLHNTLSAEAAITLLDSFGSERFPAALGLIIARSMLEIDITAHYVTSDPASRARQYIDFDKVLKKREMDACRRHRNSADST